MSPVLYSFLSEEVKQILETRYASDSDESANKAQFSLFVSYLQEFDVASAREDVQTCVDNVEWIARNGNHFNVRKWAYVHRELLASTFRNNQDGVDLRRDDLLEKDCEGMQCAGSPSVSEVGFVQQSSECFEQTVCSPEYVDSPRSTLNSDPPAPMDELMESVEYENEQVNSCLDAATGVLAYAVVEEAMEDEPEQADTLLPQDVVQEPAVQAPKPLVATEIMDVYTRFERTYEGMKHFAQSSIDSCLEDVERSLVGQTSGGLREQWQSALKMALVVGVLVLVIASLTFLVGTCVSFCMQAHLYTGFYHMVSCFFSDAVQAFQSTTASIDGLFHAGLLWVSDVMQALCNSTASTWDSPLDQPESGPVLQSAWTQPADQEACFSPLPGKNVRFLSVACRRNQELVMNMSRAPTLSWLHSSLSLAGSPRDATLALLHRFEDLDARVARLENDVESMKKVRFIQACPAPSGSSAHADEIRALRQHVEGLERRLNTVDGILFVAVGVSLSLHALRMRGPVVGGLHWLLRWTGLTYFFGGSVAPTVV